MLNASRWWLPLLVSGACLVGLPAEARLPSAPLERSSAVVLVMVDRFADGAPNVDNVDENHPRRFQGGDLKGLTKKLPELKALGFTHVWLTPLHEQIPHLVGKGDDATAGYHGYWPATFRSVDPHFGTVDDLKTMSAAAADLGMGIVLDVVVNHFGYGAKDADHLVRDSCGDDDETRCLFGLPDLRTEDPRVRQTVVDDVTWWCQHFADDGTLSAFRLDAFKHLDGATAAAITAGVHARCPGVITIAERWGAGPDDDDALVDVATGAADGHFDFSLMSNAQGGITGRLRPTALLHHLQHRRRTLTTSLATNAGLWLPFLDNHDVETWTHAVGAARSPLGAVLLLSQPGIPTITWGTWQGREGGAVDPFNRSRMDWTTSTADAANDKDAASASRIATDFWREALTLRGRDPNLWRSDVEVTPLLVDDAAGIAAWWQRVPGQATRTLVAFSLRRPLQLVFPIDGDDDDDDDDDDVQPVIYRGKVHQAGNTVRVRLEAGGGLFLRVGEPSQR